MDSNRLETIAHNDFAFVSRTIHFLRLLYKKHRVLGPQSSVSLCQDDPQLLRGEVAGHGLLQVQAEATQDAHRQDPSLHGRRGS